MIQRFEDEFPECRLTPDTSPQAGEAGSEHVNGEHTIGGGISRPGPAPDADTAVEEDDTDRFAIRLSRSGSNTSLHSRAMTSEEGQIHRIGQNLRRDMLEPSLASSDDSLADALRERLESIQGDEIRSQVESIGPDKVLAELGSTVEDLWAIRQHDHEAFERFRESQIAAQINAGIRPPESPERESPS